MEKKKVNVYVMIGFPGAGKDTWIANNLPEAHKVVCRDDIRFELGLCGKNDKIVGSYRDEQLVTGIFNQHLKEYVANGEDVAINNINISRRYRNDYKKLLAQYNVKWIYVVVEAPDLATNKERRKGQIPPEVFDRMERNYEPPTPDEYDEIIYAKQENI